jgi:hypothetical protein
MVAGLFDAFERLALKTGRAASFLTLLHKPLSAVDNDWPLRRGPMWIITLIP